VSDFPNFLVYHHRTNHHTFYPDQETGMPILKLTSFSLLTAEAFARFYEQSHLSVFRYVMVLCAGDQIEAEDITADAFYRAWEKRSQFAGSQQEALGWVIAIARNLLIDLRRAAGVRPLDAELEDDIAEPSSSIEDLLVDGEQLQQVLEVIRDLPFPQGDILALRFVLGWRVKTIAEHLGLAENTISVYLRRAVANIQRRLSVPEISAGRIK
jgi:RNA polymerase sigma-70 factor (ECF subfamily)